MAANKTVAKAKKFSPLSMVKAAAFYPAEYILMLALSFVSLVVTSWLGGAVLTHWFDLDADNSGVLLMVSVLAVTLPLHLALYWRVRHADRKSLTALSQRVANAGLGLYLLLTAGVTIALSIMFLHSVVEVVFGNAEAQKAFWVGLLVTAQAIAWFKYATFHFMRSRVNLARSKYYVLAVGLISLGIVLLALIFPAAGSRGAGNDLRRQSDLGNIEAAINDYVNEYGALPAGLGELSDLHPDVAARIDDYDYQPLGDEQALSYELCTTFSTQAGSGEDPGFGYYSHQAGYQCFQRTAGTGPFELNFENLDQDEVGEGDGLQQTLEQFLQNSGNAEDFYQFDSGL